MIERTKLPYPKHTIFANSKSILLRFINNTNARTKMVTNFYEIFFKLGLSKFYYNQKLEA